MADTKISALSAGTAAPADEIPINRAGTNFKITAGDILKINGGTITADSPVLNLTQTWNNAAVTFTGLKFNATDTTSASGSLLMDLQVGGASKLSVRKDGRLTIPAFPGVIEFAGQWSMNGSSSGLTFSSSGGADYFRFTAGLLRTQAAGSYAWSSTSDPNGTADLYLTRDAANTLAQRNSTNAQTFRLYNTFTDASNYERGKFSWSSNVLQIGTEKAGTGSARALEFQTDGTTRFYVFTNGLMGTGNSSSASATGLYFNTSGTLRMNTGAANGYFEATLWKWPSTAAIGFVPTTDGNGQNLDAVIKRGGTGILTLGNAGTITDFDRLQFGGTTSSFPALKRSSATLIARLADDTANAAFESASIKTDAPAGGTAATWKLGAVASVSPTSPNRTIEVDIGGTIYYLHAKTTND